MNPSIHLIVSVDDQSLEVRHGNKTLHRFPVSTSAKGMGFVEGSYRTPTGRFRVVEKIGDGQPAGTIFKSRLPAGHWDGVKNRQDLVLTRILRLDGLDPENSNSYARFIYIHGTNQEHLLGHPASHGCIRLSNSDMITLFETTAEGTSLVINPQIKKRGKILFIDCDSTLSSVEGIDELARAKGPEIYQQVVALTDAAMNGEVPISEVFPRRMNIIQPDRMLCEKVAQIYLDTIVPGAARFINEMKQQGWLPVILSGGFAPLIQPLAEKLGIDHVEAVPLYFHPDGTYAGYGESYPTTRNLGKNEVIREWKKALLPENTMMIGDGVSDLETEPDVDCFIAFAGVVDRPLVKQKARFHVVKYEDIPNLIDKGEKIISSQDKISLAPHETLPKLPPSMSTTTSSKGKRYSDTEKQEIVAFVEKYNSEKGRGGQKAASDQFGVSQLTIAGWIKSSGSASASKKGAKVSKKRAVKAAKAPKAPKAAATKTSASGGINAKLAALLTVGTQIEKTEKELVQLKAKFQSLKAAL